MIKNLRFVLLSMLMMLGGKMMAESQTVTFDFTGEEAYGMTLLSGSASAYNEDGTACKEGAVTLVLNGNTRWWKANSGNQLRFYKGSSMTLSVDNGNITEIKLNATAPANFEAEGYSNGVWTGSSSSVEIACIISKSNTPITSIEVTYSSEGGGEPVVVEPEQNDGTLEKPYTVAEAQALLAAFEAGQTTEGDVYVAGKVSEIEDINIDYGNATFYISDNGETEGRLYVYRVRYLENKTFARLDQLKVGDEVVICGQLVAYNGKDGVVPEMKGFVYSVNGVTKDEVSVEPEKEVISVSKALEIIDALEDGKTTAETYRVEGIVLDTPDFQRNQDGQLYGNVNFDMVEEQGGNVLTVYRAKDVDNVNFTEETINKFAANDKVVVEGQLQKYVKNDKVTPEITKGHIVSVEKAIVDSIETVKAEQNANAVYNLQGQRVQNAVKGLYIVGGKKVLF